MTKQTLRGFCGLDGHQWSFIYMPAASRDGE
jgi:hypothetical protein